MRAVWTTVRAALRRRRLQAAAIGFVLALATVGATIGLNILVESTAPFDRAFSAANGADLVIGYDTSASPAELAATRTSAHVTDSAGPWLVARAGFLANPADVAQGGHPGYDIEFISARDDPDTSVDRVSVEAGRWWQSPGEIVLAQSIAQRYQIGVSDTVQLLQAPVGAKPGPGAPSGANQPLQTRTFTVVGIAADVSTPQISGWMSPDDLTFLSPLLLDDQEMLYRVDPSATASDLAQAQASITAGLPATAVANAVTYLSLRDSVNRLAAVFVPILLAFSALALGAAAFIVVNIVSGIVLSNYRQIGLMKAIGFTPRQVVGVLVGEILVAATIGALIGVLIGTVASQPIISQTAEGIGVPPSPADSASVALIVLAIVLGITLLATVAPALRAGRLSVIDTIGRGTSPSGPGAGRAQRALVGLRLSTPSRLGLATSASHPLRLAMMFGALVVGVAAIVFAIGLNMSLRVVAQDLLRDQAAPIRVQLEEQSYPASSVTAAISQNSGTARFVSLATEDVGMSQLGAVPFAAYQGDSSWLGYALIQGRWFNGPGEVVAPTNFFRVSGLSVGDQITLALDGRTQTVTIVGEIFDQSQENRDDLVLRGDWSTLAALDPTITPSSWEIGLNPGVDKESYSGELNDATNQAASFDIVTSSDSDQGYLLIEGVILALGIVLVVISLAGVFNTVLLETRQRDRETAVLRAIGMSPRQVVTMVLARIVPVGIVAGLVGVPLGLVAHQLVLQAMADAALKTDLPQSVVNILPLSTLVLLALSGLAIACAGAIVPAARAARAQIAPVLQAE